MTDPRFVDGLLVQWGDRLFYPGNRAVRDRPTPQLRERAAAIRARIEATVVRRAPQVMVKVTGGGRGMTAIAAHLRYISKAGRLDIEDDRGEVTSGKEALRDIVDEWRFGGSRIADESARREAFNIMLSMPRGTADALTVQRAAREFAQAELAGHAWVMVLHDHQTNPHVHLSVRAESREGRRLNPRKADLRRWRETFAEKLRGHGIDAEATSRATRGVARRPAELWRLKAAERSRAPVKPFDTPRRVGAAGRDEAQLSWRAIAVALARSDDPTDRRLAASIGAFTREVSQGVDRLSRTPSSQTRPVAQRSWGPDR